MTMRASIALAIAVAEKFFSEKLATTPISELNIIKVANEEQVELIDPNEQWMQIVTRIFCAWRRCGYPRMVTSHKHAASLMCTNIQPDIVPDLKVPWNTFAVDVPDGLITSPRGRAESIIMTFDGEYSFGVVAHDDVDAPFDYLFNNNGTIAGILDPTSADDPARQMLARYVVGMAAEATQLRISEPRNSANLKRDPRGNPVTWTFQMKRDVTVDCRAAVRDACVRGWGAPSVQSMVHGHMKRQPHGPGSRDRKLIFVEAYWRGSENAPIALKSHIFHDAVRDKVSIEVP